MPIINFIDGNQVPFATAAEQSSNGAFTPHSAPEINGAVVSNTNPMPVVLSVPTSVTQNVISLAANTDTTILPSNPNRSLLGIVVLGPNYVTLGFDNPAIQDQGWPLFPVNSPSEGLLITGLNVPTNAIHAISSGNTTIVTLEGN